MFALGFPEIIIIIITLTLLGFEITMLINVIKNKQFNLSKKLLWVVALLAFQIFAAAFYYFVEYRKRS